MKKTKAGRLLGRTSNGAESDRGQYVHLTVMKRVKRPPCPFNEFGRKVIPDDNYEDVRGLCGAKAGRRSVGWDFGEDGEELIANCAKCLAKASRMKA